jgi:SAM-dependent methyltransferase
MHQVQPIRQERFSDPSRPLNLVNRIREAQQLYRRGQQAPNERVYFTLAAIRQCAKHLQEQFGVTLEGLEILNVGPGPQLAHMRALSVKNRVTGIDRDIVPQGFHLSDYLELFRQGPVLQATKLVTQKLLVRDTLFEKTLARSFGVQRFPRLPVLRMDPARMTFPGASFDLVCSWSAFEHLDTPRTALAEVARVLRPGGIAYLVLQRRAAWEPLFQEAMPGTCFLHAQHGPHMAALWRKQS